MKQNKTNRRRKFYYEFINSKLLKSLNKFLKSTNKVIILQNKK